MTHIFNNQKNQNNMDLNKANSKEHPLTKLAHPKSTNTHSRSETDPFKTSSICPLKPASRTLDNNQTNRPATFTSTPPSPRKERRPLPNQSTKTRASHSNPPTPTSGKTKPPPPTQQPINRSNAPVTVKPPTPTNRLKQP
jgi:hypothetical protein